MQGWGSCNHGREEAEGWALLQQDAFLPAGQALVPPLGFRVNAYWQGQNNAFPALEMGMSVATVGFLRGACGHVWWGHGPPGRGIVRKRAEEGGGVWELLAM